MQSSNTPTKTSVPFAASGSKNTIPVTTVSSSAASLELGFPPATRLPLGAGGVPPDGLDFNGIFNLLSLTVNWANAGGMFVYDSAFSTAIGGYPKGAVLLSADLTGQWISTAENNTTNPDTGGANWVSLSAYGIYAAASTGGTLTPTRPQYAKRIFIITGTLASNLSIVMPAIAGEWLIVNNAVLGAFNVTATTSGGTPIPLVAGPNQIYGDGTNVLLANTPLTANTNSTLNYVVAGGTANAITATYSPPIVAFTDGLKLRVKAASVNTGAVTFAPNALTARPVLNQYRLPVPAGLIQADSEIELTYDLAATSWIMTAPTSNVLASGNLNTGGDTTITIPANTAKNVDLIITDWRTAAAMVGFLQFNNDSSLLYGVQTLYSVASASGGDGATGVGAMALTRTGNSLCDGSTPDDNPLCIRIRIPTPNAVKATHEMASSMFYYRQANGANSGFQSAGRYTPAVPAAISSIKIMGRATLSANPSGANVNATSGTWALVAVDS